MLTNHRNQNPMKSWIKNSPGPKQSALNRLSELTQRIVILKRVLQEETQTMIPVKLVEIGDPNTIQTFFNTLEIIEPFDYHLNSYGLLLFDCIEANGNVHQLELLDSEVIQWHKTWDSVGPLKNPEELLLWLEAQGISEPLNQRHL